MTGISQPPDGMPKPQADSVWRSGGYAAIALVFACLSIDAGIETFVAASPLRWMVALLSVASLATVILVYRRKGLFPAAAAGLLAFLGALAASAWLPAGGRTGVVLMRLPTPAVLAGISAVALTAAAITLVMARLGFRGVRLALAAFAVYGAAAFALAAANAIPLPDLLQGGGFWAVLPWWLQGAFVGAVIALPAAIFAEVILIARVATRTRRATLTAAAMSIVAVLVFSGFKAQEPAPGEDARVVAAVAAGAAATASPFAPQLVSSPGPQPPTDAGSYQAELAKLKASIDPATFDVGARQAKIGKDPQAIFSYVQDRIRFEAYPGALRGARGALMARAGNSIDRALLEAALLNAAGHRTRFASGTISVAQAESLVRAGMRSTPPAGAELGEIVDRALGHFVLIGNALDDAGFQPPSGDAGAWERTVREAQAHTWVQIENNGQWMDADSSPGVAYGGKLVPPVQFHDQIDPQTYDGLEFDVDVELEHDGTLETRRVLERKSAAADLAGVVIGLFHERGAQTSTPVLVVGNQRISGTAFTSEPQAIGGVIGRSLMPAFGQSPTIVTGEWLRLVATGVGDQRTATYTIVDTIGPAARAARQVPQDTSSARQAVSESQDAILGMTVVTGGLPTSLPAMFLSDLSDPLAPEGVVRMLSVQNATYAALRQKLPSSFFGVVPMAYVDRPSVVLSRVQPHKAGSTDTYQLSMDLTLKASRILRPPDDPLRTAGSFYDNLASGVLDHTVERWMMGESGDASAGVGSAVEAAVKSDVPLAVVKSGTALPEALTADGRLRLTTTLASGAIGILPKSRPQEWNAALAWWGVNPSTGWTEDTNEDGCHPAAVERGAKESWYKGAYRSFCQVGRVVAGAAILTIAMSQEEPWSEEEVANIITWVCDTVNGRPRPRGGPSNPPVPPPGPAKPGFPPTSPKFPSVPKPKGPPDVPNWWSSRGTWRKWR